MHFQGVIGSTYNNSVLWLIRAVYAVAPELNTSLTSLMIMWLPPPPPLHRQASIFAVVFIQGIYFQETVIEYGVQNIGGMDNCKGILAIPHEGGACLDP